LAYLVQAILPDRTYALGEIHALDQTKSWTRLRQRGTFLMVSSALLEANSSSS